MAAALCARPGILLAADDMLYVSRRDDVPRVVPTERANRLAWSSDAPTRKRAVPPARLADAESRLTAIVELIVDEHAEPPRLSALEGAARFDALNRAFMRFMSDDEATNLRDFLTIGWLAAEVRVLALRRAWNPRAVEQSADVICDAQATWSER